jgi:UDP-N-acetylglucosamine 4,6-dehydratase/5-epimerase
MKNKYEVNNLHFIIGDISDSARLRTTLNRIKPNRIIVAAALKHIDICEYNTYESIKTNVNGIQNVMECITNSVRPELECVLFVSTDKACSPVNVYGMCKALSERIVIEKSLDKSHVRYVVVRYGNVLSSRGSLLPKFHSIGRDPEKDCFTVTHPDMTRFFMSLEQSVDLIDHALNNGKTGYTYIPDLPSYSILDIAKIYSEMYDMPIVYTGLRPGEKMHEELINEMEMRRAVREDGCFAIRPPYDPPDEGIKDIPAYTSLSHLSSDEEILHMFIEDAK